MFCGRELQRWKNIRVGSNACVNFFTVCAKSVTNSTLFCRKSELCCDFALFGMILLAFNFPLKKRKMLIYDIIVTSIVVWRSYFAHNCCQIHFTVFCCRFNFVTVYAPILGKIVFAQFLLV